jgi:plastocyanin
MRPDRRRFAGRHSNAANALRGALFALALTGAPAPAGATAAAPVAEVIVEDYKFVPAELRIRTGTTVRWINRERRTSHSVIWLGEASAESERFFPGETYERTFQRAGRFPYSCGPHPEMRGLIIVTD